MLVTKRQEETLSPRQVRALECLVSQEPDETYANVAKRAGISRAQLYRYMSNSTFYAIYNQRIRDEFRAARMQITRTLIRNARQGDVQSQRLYFQLSGLLTETIELTNSARNIETATLDPESLSPELRETLLKAIQEAQENGTLIYPSYEITDEENDEENETNERDLFDEDA